MTQTFEQWAESEGLDMSVDWKGDLTSPVTAGALRGWEGAQSAGQEAVAWRSSYVDPLTCARVYYVAQTETRARDLVAGRPYIEIEPLGVIAAPVNGGERELGQVIDERDQYHDAAEKLADAIAKHFGVEIGEHSNLNCPWQNALDHIAQATKRAADAQQVGAARYEKVDGCKDCRHAHYYSADRWECLKEKRMFDALGRPNVAPDWCPLPALTSPAKVPDAVMQALDRMSTPLHDSRLSGLTAELDAANIKTIRDYVLSGAVPAKVVGDDQHPDDAAVDRFSVAMKAKLAKKRAQGRGGWDDERICSPDDLARMLVDHVRKGDPVDVGNLAMMLFNRPDAGAALCRAALSADGGEDKRDDVDVFFDEVKAELRRARAKFPGDRIMTIALAEEFGELCKAVLDEPAAHVRKEAVQTAVMCARVVLDGDGSVNDWRSGKGLDPLTDAAIAANQAEGE
ncbi:hypothetical protein [Pandoraea pnomenusa]|uniref:hypothetical protein n=1 Tax=Pandoraea pnomenusa TaxID=93220 RepID=UPI001AD1A1A3|nr:hypothetical protein [Pandoraea pnomenusa]MBN9092047.1 hypothetical protein [Pandoraea pnomenusa]